MAVTTFWSTETNFWPSSTIRDSILVTGAVLVHSQRLLTAFCPGNRQNRIFLFLATTSERGGYLRQRTRGWKYKLYRTKGPCRQVKGQKKTSFRPIVRVKLYRPVQSPRSNISELQILNELIVSGLQISPYPRKISGNSIFLADHCYGPQHFVDYNVHYTLHFTLFDRISLERQIYSGIKITGY